ncbi:hypothetical protein OAJ27_01110 [bacterium]|nr:hypothetical protein [bacterium]
MQSAGPAQRKPSANGASASGASAADGGTLSAASQSTARQTARAIRATQQQPLSSAQRRQKRLDSLTSEVTQNFPLILSSLSGENITDKIKFLELIKQVNTDHPGILSQNPGGDGTIAEKIEYLNLIKAAGEKDRDHLYTLNPDEEHVTITTEERIQLLIQ